MIINNTFYSNGTGQWGGGISVENPDVQNLLIRNNICSQNHRFQIEVEAEVADSNYIADFNLIDGFRGILDEEIYGADSVVGDPLFVNSSSGDFHLQAGSPAINTASPTNAPMVDYDGVMRPNGAGVDIGAFEY